MSETRKTVQDIPLYESGTLRRVSGDTIRPGGYALTERALSFCDFERGARVVDVGCGTGATVEYLIRNWHFAAIGVDPSEKLLEEGKKRNADLPLYSGVGEALPLASDSMDGILAECTLSLMDYHRALLEFSRVLKVGGWLLVTDVYARDSRGIGNLHRLPVRSCVTGALTTDELRRGVEESGFEWVLWEDHSKLLAEFTVRIIFANGSLAEFWGATCGGDSMDCCALQAAIDQSRPGYFLMLARKRENPLQGGDTK